MPRKIGPRGLGNKLGMHTTVLEGGIEHPGAHGPLQRSDDGNFQVHYFWSGAYFDYALRSGDVVRIERNTCTRGTLSSAYSVALG